MSDTYSQQSGKSKSSNRNRPKVCAFCGNVQSKHYAEHATVHHGKGKQQEWVPGEDLLDKPWCDNWKEIALNSDLDQKIEPINPLPQLLRGTGKQFSQKGSQAGSIRASSIASQSIQGDDVEMNINEEEKKEVAVPQFGNPESNKNFGKRQSQTPLEDLLQEVLVQEETGESIPLINAPQAQRTNIVTAKFSGLSAKSLNLLPRASMEQKQQSPKDELEFHAPIPMAPTEYRDQGMRDQEAIQNLKVLESRTTGLVQSRVLQLVKLVPFFSQPTVSWYIEQNKDTLLNIKDLLLKAQEDVEQLSTGEISSIAFASVLFAGSVWVSLPKMFNSLDSSKLEYTLSLLRSLLTVRFNSNLAQWICTSWKYLEEQTLPLLRFLKDQHNLGDSLIANVATISTMVQIGDVKEYLTAVEVFSKYQAFRIVLESIKSLAPRWKSEQKLSFEQFVVLVSFLMKSKNQQLILKNENDLISLPLNLWMNRLTTLSDTSEICDVESIQYRLNQLCEMYGLLNGNHTLDLCLSGDTRYKRTLHEVRNPPNALQFANAQYASLSLKAYPRQLWCIPSGQGKSRTLAMIALILLLTSSTNKVHLVFDSEHLKNRDKRDFHPWLKLNNRESQVEFHVGLDFICQLGDVILIDEADEIILSNPAKFLEKIQHLKCICLTATPDNDDSRGVEREILGYLGFSFFNGYADPVSVSASVSCTETLAFPPDAELIKYILKEIKQYAVLLYCSLEFQQLLVAAGVPFLLMKDGEEINDEFLRTLDKRGPDGLHTLIVASSSFGMRGFDYRSLKGITLIIAASFAHQRQAMQGLNRVGRFGDQCKRVIAKDIALIDKEKELEYTASLVQFMNQYQKNKVVVSLKEEKKQQRPATTTATSTTSGVDKPKRTYNKKDKSSQPAITIAPVPKTKQQTVSGMNPENLSKRQNMIAGAGITNPEKGKKKEEAEEKQEITMSQIYD